MANRVSDFEYKNDSRWPALSESIDGYSAWLGEHGRSAKRCKEVRWRLEHVFAHLHAEFDVLDPHDVTSEMVAWFRRMKESTCNHPNGIRAYCQVIGHFCFWSTGYDPWDDLNTSLRTKDPDGYVHMISRGLGFDEEFDRYIDRLHRMGLRPATVLNRVRGAVRCLHILREQKGDALDLYRLDYLDMNDLRSAFEHTKEVTARVYMSSLGLFVQFVTGRNPVIEAHINWNSLETVNRKFIFVEEWYRLLDVAEPNEYLILMLGGGMGLRSSEIASIRLEDIDGDILTVHGKGHGPRGKEERMRIPPEVLDAIGEWLPIRARIIEDNGDRSGGRLLVRPCNRAGKGITASGVSEAIYSLGRKADVDLSPHSMRRLFATTLYDCGTDLVILRAMMRHALIDTTLECYIHADPRKMSRAQNGLRGVLFGNTGSRGPRGNPV